MSSRLLGIAIAMAGVASDASAGLQSAMAAALSGLQAQETTITLTPTLAPQFPRLPYFWDLGPVTDGTLFVDPVNSTRVAPAYVDGPQLTYNPDTGAASLLAPPMLGPADEFGIRSYHSPRSVTLLFGDARVASPELPSLTSYERQTVSGLSGEPSFWNYDYGPGGYQISVGGAHAVVDVLTISNFGGFRLDFERWFRPGLESTLFAIPVPPTPAPGELVVMAIGAPLPVVGAVVEYSYSFGLSGTYYGGETLLAEIVVVPEPSAAAACLVAVSLAGMSRRRR